MPRRWPWQKTATKRGQPGAGPPTVAISTEGDRSVATQHVHGNVHTGDVHQVQLAPGVIRPPDGIGVPAAGAQNLPRRPNPVFVGRDQLLAQVTALFTPTGQERAGRVRTAVGQAVTGLGGIGKSELALQYAHRRTGPGAVVWWADAENAETLELALADLAYRLQPKTAKEWTTSEAADWATWWLQAHTGWLLILDNVENPDLITELLGKLTTGDILITTRRDIDWGRHAVTSLTLKVLPRAASVALLRERLHQTADHSPREEPADDASGFDTQAADALADELGDLPLALQQAAGYITATHLPLATYLTRLRQQTGTMLGKTAPGADPHRAVARVFALTLGALTPTAPAAVDILGALAWLAPVPLPRHVISQPTHPDAVDTSTARPDIEELLALAASYSLITLTPTTVTVHRLLQATVRDHDRTAPAEGHPAAEGLTGGQTTALAWLNDAAPTAPDTNVAGWGLWRDLLPHLDVFFDQLPEELPDLDLADLLGQTGFYLWVQGRHQHALRLQQRARAITEAALGPDHPTTATVLGNTASTLDALGRHAEALPLKQRALAITEAALGADHPDTGLRLDNLAHTLWLLGQPTDALPLQERAAAITEAALGPDHPDIAFRLNNLAATLADLGRHTDALALQQRAAAITEAALGPDHPATAIRLDNLAYTLAALGRPTDALPLQQRAAAITETTLGPDHPATALRLDNLAYTLAALGRHTDAAALRERIPSTSRADEQGPEAAGR
jgi:tetratricopeptide (TPR) repeat protein